METLTNSAAKLGYSTYILGAVNNVTDCLDVILYDSTKLVSIDKLSLSNLEAIHRKVLASKEFIHLDRETKESSFEYLAGKNQAVECFDTIIYISPTGKPSGFTKFNGTQGKNRDISFNINFTSNTEHDTGFHLNIQNSLSNLLERSTNISLNKNLVYNNSEPKPNQYPLIRDISIGDDDNYPRYSSHISSYLHSSTKENLFTDCGVGITGSQKFYHLGIIKNINVDQYGNFYKEDPKRYSYYYQVNYYGVDIVINFARQEITDKGEKLLSYYIYSLIDKNVFNDSKKNYTLNEKESYKTLNLGTKDYKLDCFAGRFIIFTEQTILGAEKRIYDTVRDRYLDNSEMNLVIDLWGTSNKVVRCPKMLDYESCIDLFPDINDIYLDVESYARYNNIEIEKKIGSWYVLKQPRVINNDLFLYVTKSKLVYTCSKDKVIVINDKVLMIKTELEDGRSYYTLYVGDEDIYYTENARLLISSGRLESREDGVLVCNNLTDEEENKANEEKYKSGKVIVVWQGEDLCNSYFNKYRRNALTQFTVPEIISAINGILFYKVTNNIINYL